MFSWSTFGPWWVACRMAFWTWCSSRRPLVRTGNGLDFAFFWTWFCVCGLEEQCTNSSSSVSPSSWESSRRREKCENLPPPPNKKPPQRADPKQCKLRGWVARQTGQNFTHHLPPGPWSTQSDRRETSIFCLQNDATVRRTVTTFVCPQTQFHENLHTNFALQNLPINGHGTPYRVSWSQRDTGKSKSADLVSGEKVSVGEGSVGIAWIDRQSFLEVIFSLRVLESLWKNRKTEKRSANVCKSLCSVFCWRSRELSCGQWISEHLLHHKESRFSSPCRDMHVVFFWHGSSAVNFSLFWERKEVR